jgi:hypothetical protein
MTKDRFYIPFSLRIAAIPLMVYPVKDENPLEAVFDRRDKQSIRVHIRALYKKQKKVLSEGLYHILFVWNLHGQRMTDVWIHSLNTIAAPSGPLQKVYTFQGLEPYTIEVASGDTLIVLAREEELRRKIGDLQKYVKRPSYIPDFPMDMQPYENFYE